MKIESHFRNRENRMPSGIPVSPCVANRARCRLHRASKNSFYCNPHQAIEAAAFLPKKKRLPLFNPPEATALQRAFPLFNLIGFEQVPFLDVIEAVKPNPALVTFADLAGVVFFPLQ